MKFKTKSKDCQMTVTVSYSSADEIRRDEFAFFERKCPRGFMKISQEKKRKIEYIGPKAISLFERLKKPIESDEFFMIIEQVVYSTLLLQKNDLMWNKVAWDLKNVYINQNTKELQLIYLPFAKGGVQSVLDFLNAVSYQAVPGNPNDDYVSKFSFFIRGIQWYDPHVFENYVRNANSKSFMIVNNRSGGSSGFLTDKPMDYYSHYENRNDDEATGLLVEEEATGLLMNNNEATGILSNYEEEATGLLNEDYGYETALLTDDDDPGETTLLTVPKNKRIVLHRLSNDERIPISKAVFRVGKDPANVDYCITNNAVSRKHADFIVRGDNVFVVDLGSKNGTYINDRIVPAQAENLASAGDRVKLGNEEFVIEEG